ncbi:hypothetical protein Tco_0370661, partial [Tanacetum coccineum]
MLMMQAQENGVELDEEQLLFIAGGQDNAVDEDMDEPPVQDLAHPSGIIVFQADDCDAFDSDVDEAPTTDTDYAKCFKISQNLSIRISCFFNEGPSAQCVSVTTQNNVVDKSLTAELATYKEQVELYERRTKFELTEREQKIDEHVFEIGNLKEQLQGRDNTIRELKAKITCLQKKHSEADPILDLKALDSQNKDLNAKVNALYDLNDLFFRQQDKKVKQHYKELYDSIKLTRVKTFKKTTSLLTKIENLKAQIKGKMKWVTMHSEKPKLLAHGMYVIDVEPIPTRNRNNREVHLDYLKHLKESVARLREIIEEARVEKLLDSSLASACLYTKHSSGNFSSLEYSSGSKPRSNTKKDRTLPAKSDTKKVEDHPRNNKSSVKQKNHVDSSISYKRRTDRPLAFGLRLLKTYDGESLH